METANYWEKTMAGNIRLVFSLILIGLIVVFSIQNVAEVEVQFLFWSFTTRRAFLIFAVLAIGVLVGWILHSMHRRSQSRESGNRVGETESDTPSSQPRTPPRNDP